MKPEYEPKGFDAKLGYLVEECGEVLHAAGKTLRWGLDSFNPELPPGARETNRHWLLREIADLKRAIAIVEDEIQPASMCPHCEHETDRTELACGCVGLSCCSCDWWFVERVDSCRIEDRHENPPPELELK